MEVTIELLTYGGGRPRGCHRGPPFFAAPIAPFSETNTAFCARAEKGRRGPKDLRSGAGFQEGGSRGGAAMAAADQPQRRSAGRRQRRNTVSPKVRLTPLVGLRDIVRLSTMRMRVGRSTNPRAIRRSKPLVDAYFYF